MNDSFGGNAFNTTAGNDGGVPAEQKAEGIAPVLIKQILDCENDKFHLYGTTFGIVSLVGIVRDTETSSTKITYLIEDHTGQINVHYWLEEGDTLKAPNVMINNYTHIYGAVRQLNGKRTIMAFNMSPVESVNEISTHLLEVLNARYKSEDFSKKDPNDTGSFAGAGGSNDFSVLNSGNNLGLEKKQLAVLEAIKSHYSESGISLDELQAKFNHMSQYELRNILDFMLNEGHIYTSTDSNHFLSTDG